MDENLLLTPIQVFIEQEIIRRRSDLGSYSNIVKHPYKLINVLASFFTPAQPLLHEAIAIPEQELCKIRSFGKKSLSVWQTLLEPYGLAPGMNHEMQEQIMSAYYRELNHNHKPYMLPSSDVSDNITVEQALRTLFSLGCSVTLTPNPKDYGTVEQ